MHTKIFIAVLGTLSMVFSGALAQTINVAAGDGVKIKGVEQEAQKTPNFQAGDVKNKNVKKPREWLEVEVEFEVDKVRPNDAVLPELLFRYYIGLVNEQNQPVVLTGDVTHVNVIGGEDYFSVVYVAPSTLGKITGEFQRLDMGKVKAVGVEIFYNGVKVGAESSTGRDFWSSVQQMPGVLSKDKTPFALLWIDRYPELKSN